MRHSLKPKPLSPQGSRIRARPKKRLDYAQALAYIRGMKNEANANSNRGRRIFVDAPAAQRCAAVVTLKDKTTAQCGRRFVVPASKLCKQHSGMAGR